MYDGTPVSIEEIETANEAIHKEHPPKISRKRWISQYCEGSDVETVFERRHVEACSCDYKGCQGWGGVPDNLISVEVQMKIQEMRANPSPKPSTEAG